MKYLSKGWVINKIEEVYKKEPKRIVVKQAPLKENRKRVVEIQICESKIETFDDYEKFQERISIFFYDDDIEYRENFEEVIKEIKRRKNLRYRISICAKLIKPIGEKSGVFKLFDKYLLIKTKNLMWVYPTGYEWFIIRDFRKELVDITKLKILSKKQLLIELI